MVIGCKNLSKHLKNFLGKCCIRIFKKQLKSSDFFLKNTQEYTIEYSSFIFISFILQNFAPKKMTHHNMHI
jgi:hypothetical protein